MINKDNTFAKKLTVAQLKKIWEPNSKIKTWKQVNPTWPNEEIKLYGPGPDSGTFDYFTEAVMGKSRASRHDYTASEDDNVLVTGIAGSKYSLGYFGYAYYLENKSKIQAAAIDAGKGAIAPNGETIASGNYPLSRPLFIYVSKQAAQDPLVEAFVEFYLENAPTLAKQVGYSELPSHIYKETLKRFKTRKTGVWASSMSH